jgi:calcium permeable stress-gated cation channel
MLKELKGNSTGRTLENSEGQFSKVPYESRPKHRSTPLVGKKIDTIDWARQTLPGLENRVQKYRRAANTSAQPENYAVFVAYSSPAAAQRAYRNVNFHPAVSSITSDRFIGVQPKEALWSNVTLSRSSRIARASAATTLIVAMILFWTIPIGFVGAISNIKYLANKVKFLRFLNNLPVSIIGLISGLLPPLVISTLVSYVPKILRCTYLRKISPTSH